MSEMVERVARGIMGHAEDDGHGPRSDWREFRDAAIAAIAAMRDPPRDVEDAGRRMMPEAAHYDKPDDFLNAWQAAIDAALKDET